MPENSQAEGDSKKPEKADRNPFNAAKSQFKRLPIGLRVIATAALIGFLIIVGIAVLHPSLNERWKFGTDRTLNLLILFAIAVQAYIYTKQREVMQRQAEYMDEQLATMREQGDWAIYYQRPWMALTKPPELTKNKPLWFDEKGIPHVVEVMFTAQNKGTTPALNFGVSAALYPHDLDREKFWADKKAGRSPEGEYIPECNPETMKHISIKKAKMILPHSEITVFGEKADATTNDKFPFTGKETEIYLIGCIAYTDTLQVFLKDYEYLNDAPKHATSFITQYVGPSGETTFDRTGSPAGHFVIIGQNTYR